MFKRKTFKIFGALFLASVSVFAQDPPAQEKWTLQECVDLAVRNNIQVKQSGLNSEVEKVVLTQSKLDLLPSLNASTGYSYSVGRSINPFSNLIVDQPVSSQNTSLSTSVTLFSGFQKINTIKRNKYSVEASQYLYEDTQNRVTLQVITAYTNILLNNELLENAERRLETTELQLERTSKLVEAGSLPESNLLDIRAQKADDELAIINAQNSIDISKLNLKQLMQLPADEEIEIVVPNVDTPDEEIFNENLTDIYNTAVAVQPSVKAADARVETSEYDVAIAKGNRLPSITASAFLVTRYSSVADDFLPKEGSPLSTSFDTVGFVAGNPSQKIVAPRSSPTEFTENTYLNQLDFNLNRGLQVDLNIPIFNGGQVRSAVSRARINREIASYDAIDARNELRQNIEQAYLDVLAAQKRYEATKTQVESLQEAFRVNEQRFNLGAINSLDYNLAQTNLNVAESDLIQAKYEFIFKTKILDFYQGRPIAFE